MFRINLSQYPTNAPGALVGYCDKFISKMHGERIKIMFRMLSIY
jgi:hypothetical protein